MAPSPVVFAGQPADTIGDTQTITITSPGQVPITLGKLRASGADAGDFVPVADQCSGQSLLPAASCTVGVRFAPQATGPAARRATLDIAYADGSSPPAGAAAPPFGVVSDSLSGAVEPTPAGATGATGPAGPVGSRGSAGAAGANGVVSCTAKLVLGPVKFTTSPRTIATLSRAWVVFAIGRGMVLEVVRPTRPGRYFLTQRRGWGTIRHEITLR
jgi:hypothetical protein